MTLITVQFYPAPSYVLEANTFLTTLFWNTLKVCSSLNTKHKVTTPIMIVLYILIFMFICSRQTDRRHVLARMAARNSPN
jgi:hypothetical protein